MFRVLVASLLFAFTISHWYYSHSLFISLFVRSLAFVPFSLFHVWVAGWQLVFSSSFFKTLNTIRNVVYRRKTVTQIWIQTRYNVQRTIAEHSLLNKSHDGLAITWHTLNAYHSVTRQLMFIFHNVPNARCPIYMTNAHYSHCSSNESSETNHLQIPFPSFCPYYCPFYVELRIALFAFKRCAFLYNWKLTVYKFPLHKWNSIIIIMNETCFRFFHSFFSFPLLVFFLHDIQQHFHCLN